MLDGLKLKLYKNLKSRYPKAETAYKIYKLNNSYYHNKHKLKSAGYFIRLIKAEKKGKN